MTNQPQPKTKFVPIASDALGDTRALAWSNLGCWDSPLDDYPTAAQRLAVQLAEQMGLQDADSILDVGCGYGASLLVWHQWGINRVVGVECQPAAVARWQAWMDASIDSPINVSFGGHSVWELAATPAQQFAAVIAVDAAYQWAWADWLAVAARMLRQDGVLGCHYLVWSARAEGLPVFGRGIIGCVLRGFGVVRLSSVEDLQDALNADFTDVRLTDLSPRVFAGFAEHAKSVSLPWRESWRAALKIRLTGWLCGRLARNDWVRYLAVSAKRR